MLWLFSVVAGLIRFETREPRRYGASLHIQSGGVMAMVSTTHTQIARASAAAWQGKWLHGAAFAWLAVAIAGQLMFALYVAGFYGRTAVQGRLPEWTKVLSHGHVPGDFFSNAMIWLHLIFTVAIILGGIVQLIPRIRSAAPAFHRVNGRVYLAAALVLSVTGLVMMWTRGTVGDVWLHLGTSANGIVIIACAAMAWRHARARAFDLHRRWALRLFLAVSGVWFFRVGLMFWLIANQGPVGFDPKTFTGPFIGLLAFAQFLLPLALLELYFAAQRSRSARLRVATAAVLAIATLVTAAGVGAAAMMMWLPRI